MKPWFQLLFWKLPGPLSVTALTLLLSPTIHHVIEKSDDVSFKSILKSYLSQGILML